MNKYSKNQKRQILVASMVPFLQPLQDDFANFLLLVIEPDVVPHVVDDDRCLVLRRWHPLQVNCQERVTEFVHARLNHQVRLLQLSKLFCKVQHCRNHRPCSHSPHPFLVNVRVRLKVFIQSVFASIPHVRFRNLEVRKRRGQNRGQFLLEWHVERVFSDGRTQ